MPLAKTQPQEKPPLTPAQVMERLGANKGGELLEGSWKFYLDGPQGSPSDLWGPVASDSRDVTFGQWYTDGEPGDNITENNVWLYFT